MPGLCLAPIPGVATAPVTTPMTPCFATPAMPLEISLAGFTIALEDVRMSATYALDGTLSDGLLLGFLSEAVASGTLLPASLPLVGGAPLSSVLKASDKDLGPTGTSGWWFHLNFLATPAAFSE